MDIVFSKTTVAPDTTTLWPLYWNREQLQLLLQQAAERAALLGHEVLISLTQPVKSCDPLHVFIACQSAQLGETFYWSRPSEQRALVGTGAALNIESSGPDRVAIAAATWHQLQRDAIINQANGHTPLPTDGPLLFGGFAFDPLNTKTPLWQDFPDGLLILPSLLFHCHEENAALTINTLVQPGADIEQLIEEINAHILSLNTNLQIALAQPFVFDSLQNELAVQDLIPPSAWMEQVADAVATIQADTFGKVMLARAVQVTQTPHPFDIAATLYHLSASYPAAYVFALQRGSRYFMGATPERLLCGADGQIQTMALAGSAPRGATDEEDRQLGIELLQSQKNQDEHHFVVATIQNALAVLCSRVWVADAPHLLKLKNIQHLQTPISGDLLPGHSVLEAIEALHPTPAVGGYPRQPALAFIRDHEALDRGWYAAPIGWIGASGNGEFAVALRSALVAGHQATLFAGCGIVADSEPASELAESGWKLQVMLRGLAGNE